MFVTKKIISLLCISVKGSKWRLTQFHHFPAKILSFKAKFFFSLSVAYILYLIIL